MINGIITGHGDFSLGMLNALEMIAGKQDKMKAIPFYDGESFEEYQGKIGAALEEFSKEDSQTIVFTDLKGGTPFNVSMLLTNNKTNVKVIAGSNLPILLEFVGKRWSVEQLDDILNSLIQTAIEGLVIGEINQKEIDTDEDGI